MLRSRKAPNRFAATALCLGTFLLGLNLLGLILAPAPHVKALTATVHKNGLHFLPSDKAMSELDRAWAEPDPQDRLQRLTKTVAAAIVNYWPPPGTTDPDVFYSPWENWVIAGLQQTEQLLSPSDPLFQRLERTDFRQAIAKGVGYCSQAALAISDYLNERGIETSMVGLDGHVVATTRLAGTDYLLDPDYGVVIRASLRQAENDPEMVAQAYETAGYTHQNAIAVAKLYGADGNAVLSPQSYAPSQHWAQMLKWGVPIMLFAFAGALWVLRRWRLNEPSMGQDSSGRPQRPGARCSNARH